jgi:hypothetical protein
VIPGGGVVEGGAEAARMQAEVAEIAIATGTAVVGPNCMGVVDLTTRSATYIGDLNPWLRRGGVYGIAQSGSVSDAFIHAGTRIGWSRIVSCGSEVVLDLCDYLAHGIDDPATEAFVLFIEGFKRPERFLALADRALAAGKPIFAVKVGRSAQPRPRHRPYRPAARTGSSMPRSRRGHRSMRRPRRPPRGRGARQRARRLGRQAGRGGTSVILCRPAKDRWLRIAARTGLDRHRSRPRRGQDPAARRPWARRIRSIHGAQEGGPTYRTCLEAFATSGEYDVRVRSDFPFRSQPGEVVLATELAASW